MGKVKSEILGVKEKITELEKEELKLFHSYNRHAQAKVKLEILNRLIVVINQIDILKSIQS